MASSSSTPPSSQQADGSAPETSNPESFTMIGDRDLEAIGAHCHYTYCNQLDFLPFRCESCRHTYCLDHRTESSHECPKAGSWAAARRAANLPVGSSGSGSTLPSSKPTLTTATQCSHPQCKTFINTHTSVGVACPTCNRSYCLKHRLREDHSCSTLTPLGARQSDGPTQAQKGLAALNKLRAWGREKAVAASAAAAAARPKPAPTSAAARQLALNNLKKSAKGDTKIPAEKRVYLHVEAEAATTTAKFPKGQFFYNGDWSVGRMLDEAARQLQVENVNNRGGGEDSKLRVFHVEGGRLLEFGEKVKDPLVSGSTIVLLRGVGPAVPDLIKA